MKRMIVVVISALSLFVLGTVNAELAGRGRMGIGLMDDEYVYYGASLCADLNLNLTVEQENRIRYLDEKYAREIKSIQAQLYSKGKTLKSEWLLARPDRRKITALEGEVRELRDQMLEKMTSHRRGVHEVLTPKQRTLIENDGMPRSFPKKDGYRW